MIKGYHIPLGFKEREIIEIGTELLSGGYYEAIEIKYPFGMESYDSESYLNGIGELMKQFSPEVTMHIPTNLDIGHANPAVHSVIMDEIKRSIDFAGEYDVSYLPIHPGTIGTMDIPDRDGSEIKELLIAASEKKKLQAREATVKSIVQLSDYLAGSTMKLALENVLLPQEIVYSPGELDDMLKAVNRKNVEALFDCGHSNRCGIDPADFIHTLESKLGHVHINDNDGSCDLHLSMGKGNIDYTRMFQALKNKAYGGIVVMETIYKSAADLILDAEKLDRYIGS
ncbi:TIM barrel protein [Bacillus mangrovi]|uniref:TIM barrel protein n=1 Tax=Metabacillus mangrovi TaxID=1491830 RepID=A0A7X2S5V4_9BACI|nr:sugar phosphate isomerase/epimerase [Metabacillus mangrovi]MTH54234.1 TIM barrel protein [Metabacillus mangrovi]